MSIRILKNDYIKTALKKYKNRTKKIPPTFFTIKKIKIPLKNKITPKNTKFLISNFFADLLLQIKNNQVELNQKDDDFNGIKLSKPSKFVLTIANGNADVP